MGKSSKLQSKWLGVGLVLVLFLATCIVFVHTISSNDSRAKSLQTNNFKQNVKVSRQVAESLGLNLQSNWDRVHDAAASAAALSSGESNEANEVSDLIQDREIFKKIKNVETRDKSRATSTSSAPKNETSVERALRAQVERYASRPKLFWEEPLETMSLLHVWTDAERNRRMFASADTESEAMENLRQHNARLEAHLQSFWASVCAKSVATKKIPRIVWMFWHDAEKTPELIQFNVQRTTRLMQDSSASYGDASKSWQVRFLNLKGFLDLCPSLPRNFMRLTPTHQSDYVRLYLLETFGGVWMDASLVLNESLESIWSGCLDSAADLGACYGRDASLTTKLWEVETFFLCAPKDSKIIRAWRREFQAAIEDGFEVYRERVLRIGDFVFASAQNNARISSNEHGKDLYFSAYVAFQAAAQPLWNSILRDASCDDAENASCDDDVPGLFLLANEDAAYAMDYARNMGRAFRSFAETRAPPSKNRLFKRRAQVLAQPKFSADEIQFLHALPFFKLCKATRPLLPLAYFDLQPRL